MTRAKILMNTINIPCLLEVSKLCLMVNADFILLPDMVLQLCIGNI